MNVSININGETIKSATEARTTLADFLRDQQELTGLHLGCEHGVCGACTVMIDGSPARACNIFAVSCEGAEIRTIEGYENDQLVNELQHVFSENHALQCGYCTPAMLITARDIITRLPNADADRVRLELAGNLCRCTGYSGIVKSILVILDRRRKNLRK